MKILKDIFNILLNLMVYAEVIMFLDNHENQNSILTTHIVSRRIMGIEFER